MYLKIDLNSNQFYSLETVIDYLPITGKLGQIFFKSPDLSNLDQKKITIYLTRSLVNLFPKITNTTTPTKVTNKLKLWPIAGFSIHTPIKYPEIDISPIERNTKLPNVGNPLALAFSLSFWDN